MVRRVVGYLKGKFVHSVESLGRFAMLCQQIFVGIFVPPYDWKNIFVQMYEVGVRSFPITSLTSLSTGMVLALQTGSSAQYVFNEPLYVGTVVTFSLVKELAPVLTATVVAGRVGAAIAAELGTMKVTEQIDALYTLGTNPVKYLAIPRFLACILMVPILTLFADIVGSFGGFLIGTTRLDIPSTIYWADAFDYMRIKDLFHGLIKSVFFGGSIALIACYKGFVCEGGAEGVGKSTTSAVMTILSVILIGDYFLSAILVALRIG